MRVECELVRDDLTQEERDDLAARNAANREAGSKKRDRLFAATATCLRCGNECRGTGSTCHVVGWTVCAQAGEISKVVPLRLIAQDGCEPDRKLMLKFATRLAGRGYRISVSDEKAPGPKAKRTKAKSETSKS